MVKDIAFFAYSVRDVPRARAFYSETLGAHAGRLVRRPLDRVQCRQYDLRNRKRRAAGIRAWIFHRRGLRSGRHARPCENGSEPAASRSARCTSFPACMTCFARDPEGNRFALHQRRTPAQENVA